MNKIFKFTLGFLLLFNSLAYAFNVPTEEYTPDAYDVLLIHAGEVDGSTTPDDASASNHTITCAANAQVDTAQYKFATGSILFDGTGDNLSVADSEDFNLGSGNFTIDFWFRATVVTSDDGLFSLSGGTAANMDIWIANSGKLMYNDGTGYYSPPAGTISVDTWYHVAVVRNGNTINFYLDGVSKYSFDCTGLTYNCGAGGIWIGQYYATDFSLNGWIDEFRISKGIARDWITASGKQFIWITQLINNLNPNKIGASMWSCKIRAMCWWKNRRIT